MSLRWQKLHTIPAALFDFSDITSLDLSHNRLTQLPPGIGNLRKLYYLDLSNNSLQSLPTELGMLVGLKTLNLYNNRLTRLPYQLGSLRRLKNLCLDQNPLALEQKAAYAKDEPQTLIKYLQEMAPEMEPPEARKTIDLGQPVNVDAKDKISVLSYNTLSHVSATPERYSSVPTNVLSWETRREAILGEITEQRSDVFCLQEIDTENYHDYWTPQLRMLGYAGVF